MKLKDLEKITEKKLKTCDSSRDHATYTGVLLKINEQLAAQAEGQWWLKLRDLKEASESIEVLQFNDSALYKSIFENGEKKKPTIFVLE